MNKAQYVKEVTVVDPDSKGEVEISIFKHENGGMFGVDSSFIEQVFEDGELVAVADPLCNVDKMDYVVLQGVSDE